MARIRTIKPEFWQDEKLAPLSPIDRLVFLGLVSQADDSGRLVDSVRLLDGLLFPLTEDSSAESLETLRRLGVVLRYTSDSGQKLIQITGWERHQKVKNPSQYTLPGPSTETLRRTGGDSTETMGITIPDPRSPNPDPRSPEKPLAPAREADSPPEVGSIEDLPDGSDFIHPTRRMPASEVLAAWESIQPGPVPEPERRKQSRTARKIADHHTADEVKAAMVGMTKLFPHCPPKSEPWDLADLDRKFSKALAKARDHPAIRDEAEVNAFLASRGVS